MLRLFIVYLLFYSTDGFLFLLETFLSGALTGEWFR
jgi:hypothetical protein